MVALRRPLSPAADPMLPWMGMLGTLSMLAVLVGREDAREELRSAYAGLRSRLADPRRRGLGGRLSAGSGSGESAPPARDPVNQWKKVQVGWKRVPRQVPVYETRKVKVGTKTVTSRVPRWTMKRVKVGTKTETYRVKVTRYRTKRRTEWVKKTVKVPVYRSRKYLKGYRWKRVRKTKWVRRGWRYVRKTHYQWQRKPVYGRRKVRVGWKRSTRWQQVTRTRKVPYTAYQTRTRQVPVVEMRRVRDGWKTVSYQVPRFEDRKVQVGTRTLYDREPLYRWKKDQAAGRQKPTFWKGSIASYSSKGLGLSNTPSLEKRNGGEEGPDPKLDYAHEKERFPKQHVNYFSTQTERETEHTKGTPIPPTMTPYLQQAPSPAHNSTPYPIVPRTTGKYDPSLKVEGKWIAKGARWVKKAKNFFTARAVAFNTLESGHISVSAPSKAVGTRRSFLNKFGFSGTRYKPSTISGITGRHLIKGSLSKTTWITAAVTSLAGNVIDYGFGKNKDKGIASQEFAVSTAVDTVMAVGTGLVAASTVALIGAGIAAVTPFALSAAAGVALTAVVGVGIGYALDRFGVNKKAKVIVNKGVDKTEEEIIKLKNNIRNGAKAWGGVMDNAKIIGQYVKDQARNHSLNAVNSTGEKLNKSAENIQAAVKNTADRFQTTFEDMRESVNDSVSKAANKIKGIFGE
jgi:membrane protein YqaA with SNARE-associated domain